MNADNVEKLANVKQQIKTLNDQLKILSATRTELEETIIEQLVDSGMTLARTTFGTVGVNETVVPNVQDWTQFEEYIYENKALYLLQRRAAAPAFRDEIDVKGEIPGVTPFVKKTLSLTSASK